MSRQIATIKLEDQTGKRARYGMVKTMRRTVLRPKTSDRKPANVLAKTPRTLVKNLNIAETLSAVLLAIAWIGGKLYTINADLRDILRVFQ